MVSCSVLLTGRDNRWGQFKIAKIPFSVKGLVKLDNLIFERYCSIDSTFTKSHNVLSGEKMTFFRMLILFCLLFPNIFFSSYCYANVNDDQKKATEFMQLKMYPPAIALWEKVAETRKNDPNVFFQLGKCNARLAKFEESEKWFAKAIQSDASYAFKIGRIYLNAAYYLKEKGDILSYHLALEKAKTYDPNIGKRIEKEREKEIFPNGNLNLTTFDINSKFINNDIVGKLFVISGKVKNNYNETRRMVTIIGKIFTKGKVMVDQETVYGGNIIPDNELVSLEWNKIKGRLSNPKGGNKSNARIKPGQSIPFMLVFSDLPEDLEEFTIEVLGSKPF
jgi:tetratricopeptide (TPR) repeat protein